MDELIVPLKIDLKQFLQFFSQLSPESKEQVLNALKSLMKPKSPAPQNPFPLKGTVLKYDSPFEPVGEKTWEVLK